MHNQSPVILNLSAIDYRGAGKFSVDFHRLLLEGGARSYLVVKESKTGGEGIMQYRDSKYDSAYYKLLRKVNKRRFIDRVFAYDYYFYNKYERFPVVSAQKIIALLPSNPDVIFVHWVTDFVNAKIIGELKRLTNARIFWLMVDNAPLTGGCHYPWDCQGFTRDCANCPAIIPDNLKWLAAENLAFKNKYLPDDTGVIAFSASDHRRARKSALFRNKPVRQLIGFVDETRFMPADKAAVRSALEIPEGKKVLFFGASSLTEKRKGMSLLLEVLSSLKRDDIFLLIAGGPATSVNGHDRKYLGYLSEDELVMAYQAADVFVCPSIEDSGPMMINQSLMCGTPVAAFHTGVAEDLVISWKTGYLAISRDTADMAKGINGLLALDSVSYQKMSSECRALAMSLYGKDAMLSDIKKLIR